MAGNGKKYTYEFKKQIVRLYKSGKSISTLNREYGVTRSTIRRWIHESEEESKPITVEYTTKDGKISFKNITKKEYEQTLKKLEELRLENEILKKAIDIFAKESQKP